MQHRSRSFLGAAASLTLLVGVAACGSDDKASTTTAERTTDSVERTDAATTTDSTEDSDDVSVPDDDEVSTTEEGEDVTTTADDTDGNDVDTSDWVVYESPEGTYSASFPSEPTTQTQNAPLPDGSTLALTIVSSQQGQTFFATASGVYPAAPPTWTPRCRVLRTRRSRTSTAR